jgi:cysteine synthase A
MNTAELSFSTAPARHADDKRLVQLEGLRAIIGHTPLLQLKINWRGRPVQVFAKAEYMNLTGSIKDRMALHILGQAVRSGRLKSGNTIVEATSGNTGIAMSAIGCALGHEVIIYMPDWMSEERKALIRSFGARIELVSKADGGFLGSIALAEQRAREDSQVFLPRQFSNDANVDAHEQHTGKEIVQQLVALGLVADAFVAGVGTGGTVMGVGRALKSSNPAAHIHPLEPAESPTLSTGCKVGHHRIQGVSDEFIPAICKLDELDEIISINDGDSIIMAQQLARRLGLGVGISSGANLLGALKLIDSLGDDAIVVTVFSDDNKKYLSTGLLKTEPEMDDYLSTQAELVSFCAYRTA